MIMKQKMFTFIHKTHIINTNFNAKNKIKLKKRAHSLIKHTKTHFKKKDINY